MSAIRSSTGLVSGLDISQLASALVARQQAAITRIEQRGAQFSAQQTAITGLEASVLTLQTSAQSFTRNSNYEQFSVSGASDSINVTAGSDATPGNYSIRSVRLASTHAVLSKGFASPTASVGTGTITVKTGGELEQDVLLEALNAGAGVQGGVIRITNRDGESEQIDLSSVVTVSETLDAINAAGLDVVATANDDRIEIADSTGGAGNLIIEDVSGAAARDLGITADLAADNFSGTSIFEVTGAFSFEFLEGELELRRFGGADDLRITATDGTEIDVNLDNAQTLDEIIAAINDDDENGGKVAAQLTNGRLELVDSAGGGGTLAVEDINDAAIIEVLGFTDAAVGNTITGQRLSAGLNSSLLRSLNGGQGITTPGEVSLTNRDGETATIDLSSAETLQDVVNAINGATSVGLVDLQLSAEINESGTGLTIRDNSGGSGNLVISDTTGTVAADLNIDIDAAVDEVEGAGLNRRFVNEATSIEKYAPDGKNHDPGQIQITDSAGKTAAINFSTAVETIGDVIQRINAEDDIDVTAALNETGDGFVLIDEAGGAGTLLVEELDGTTAADLRLLDDATTGGDGKQRISSRFAAVVEVTADDTLEDVVSRINEAAGFATASVLNDGSRLNSSRLSLISTTSGNSGRLVIESDIDLGLFQTAGGDDAIAQVGAGTGTAFLTTSETNRFNNVIADLDVTLVAVQATADTINVSPNFGGVRAALSSFVDTYNSLNTNINQQTSYNADTQQRGVLFGDGFVLRTQSRFTTFVNQRFGVTGNSVRNLADLGIGFNTTGTMTFDQSQFDSVSSESPTELAEFFDGDGGFGTELDALVTSLTDSVTGGFATQKNSLQRNVDETESRVETLRQRLVTSRERYLLEFAQMESILASLESQSAALTQFAGGSSN